MPELAEVETVRRGVHNEFVGSKVISVDFNKDFLGKFFFNDVDIIGHRIEDTARIGKHMFILTDRNCCIHVHLGMSGQIHCSTDNTFKKHTHVTIHLQNRAGWHEKMEFIDPRRFGFVKFQTNQQAFDEVQSLGLGPDALEVNLKYLMTIFSRSNRTIFQTLLDQSLIAGLGKIYATEILFSAGVLPTRISSSLLEYESIKIHQEMKRILIESIEYGGTSFDQAYKDVYGNPGRYQKFLNVFQREGQLCFKCQQPVGTIMVNGKRIYCCHNCQK